MICRFVFVSLPANSARLRSFEMDLVYLDNNATTQPASEVVAEMLPFLTEWYGNPSSVHRFGQRARQAVDEARAKVAALVHCADSEILFTGGGTEAINTAIRGLLAARSPRRTIVISAVEHSATRELCAELGRQGLAEIVEIPVDVSGTLDLDTLGRSIGDDTAVVSMLWANNETGVLFPVDVIANSARPNASLFIATGRNRLGKFRSTYRLSALTP